VIGDAGRLKQILLNILGNAIKFTTKGEITVQVRYTQYERRQADLYFNIIDTGIGIAEDKIRSIFDLFSQADNSITRKYGGTGLGLSISSRLVELMGEPYPLKVKSALAVNLVLLCHSNQRPKPAVCHPQPCFRFAGTGCG
jgi:signal transduction histidine kinase